MEVKKSQAEKFRDTAKEVETDDDEKRFDERLRKLTKAPPPEDDKSASEH